MSERRRYDTLATNLTLSGQLLFTFSTRYGTWPVKLPSFIRKYIVKRDSQLSGMSSRFVLRTGQAGRIEVLPTAGMVEESYELFGEGFRARVVAGSGVQRSLQGWRNGQLALEEYSPETEPEDLRNGAYEEVVEFVRALKTGSAPGRL